MDVKIIVATHKPCWMPQDPLYLPVHVGHAGKAELGYAGDDTGENISVKNAHYCELTGLYWAWKNLPADYLGLAHYRRHFTTPGAMKGDKRERVLTEAQLRPLLATCDVFLAKPRHYWIETNWQQYAHAHHEADLQTTREILRDQYPRYLPVFDREMKRRGGHRFNMFIMKRDRLDAYCQWLFDVLFELEKRLDISQYSANDARVFGFVAERLLDVWLKTNEIAYRELPYVFLDRQNWLVKGWRFFVRKFRRRV
jgi:hypothetical protein